MKPTSSSSTALSPVTAMYRATTRGNHRKSLEQRARIGKIAAQAHPEHRLARLAIFQLEPDLQRATRIECRAQTARQARALHRGGIAQAAIHAQELEAIAADAARTRFVRIDV